MIGGRAPGRNPGVLGDASGAPPSSVPLLDALERLGKRIPLSDRPHRVLGYILTRFGETGQPVPLDDVELAFPPEDEARYQAVGPLSDRSLVRVQGGSVVPTAVALLLNPRPFERLLKVLDELVRFARAEYEAKRKTIELNANRFPLSSCDAVSTPQFHAVVDLSSYLWSRARAADGCVVGLDIGPSIRTVAGIVDLYTRMIQQIEKGLGAQEDFVPQVSHDEEDGSGFPKTPPSSNKVFVVHGRDDAAKEKVARFLHQLGLQPIILHEQPDKGRTIIEKFEEESDVGFAVVLLTPDDMGSIKGGEPKPRARQNVLLELGYFIGKLGRKHVCPLLTEDIEVPSDYLGVLYKILDENGGWRAALAGELQAARIDIEQSKLVEALTGHKGG